jgi:hypothetical protein
MKVNGNVETDTLEVIANKIVEFATQADENVINAAVLVRIAKDRVENGEAGEITWTDWAKQHLPLKESRLRELEQIAKANDPNAELDRLRMLSRQRQQKHRNKKAEAAKTPAAPLRNGAEAEQKTKTIDDDRQRLIQWTNKAQVEQITNVLRFIDTIDDSGFSPIASASQNNTTAA